MGYVDDDGRRGEGSIFVEEGSDRVVSTYLIRDPPSSLPYTILRMIIIYIR